MFLTSANEAKNCFVAEISPFVCITHIEATFIVRFHDIVVVASVDVGELVRATQICQCCSDGVAILVCQSDEKVV
jgi:hypothetical protein